MFRQPRPLVPYMIRQPFTSGYIAKVKAVQTASLIDFWTLNDASGTAAVDAINTARNGLYVNSPTLQAATFADNVNKAPAFVAASTQAVNLFSASLAGVINGAEGTLLGWMNITAGNWADASAHFGFMVGADVNNRAAIAKNSAAKQLTWVYVAGGTSKSVIFTYTTAPTTWIPVAITWSKSNDRMRAYLSGSQTGADQTALGTYSGNAASGWCYIGRYNTTFYGDGNFAMGALWTKELTAAEVLTISTAP